MLVFGEGRYTPAPSPRIALPYPVPKDKTSAPFPSLPFAPLSFTYPFPFHHDTLPLHH